jgi:hypothetical protein
VNRREPRDIRGRDPAGELSVLVATSNPNNRDQPPQHDNSDPENDN